MGDGYRRARDELKGSLSAERCVALSVNTTPEIHRQLVLMSEDTGKSLDDICNAAIVSHALRHHMRQDVRKWYEQNGGTPADEAPEDWVDKEEANQ